MNDADSQPSDRLKIEFPSQGWRQILTGRQEMLSGYDRAREQSKSHAVGTFHGNVGEAECRKWLEGFLPKRYGVTSGYIISPGLPSSEKTPHFDVIIYDKLESPVLWIEGSPDASEQGKALAIPVEHVYSVLEVKSAFTPATVRDAIAHLGDLRPLMKGPDCIDERYKLHLPPTFSCGMVFYELRKAQFYSETALSAIIEGIRLRGYFGGLILRWEGSQMPQSGRLSIVQSKDEIKGLTKEGKTPLLEFGMSNSVKVAESLHIGAELKWGEPEFSQFAFDLIAMMQGKYEVGRLSSFYGMGNSFWEMARESEVRQKAKKAENQEEA